MQQAIVGALTAILAWSGQGQPRVIPIGDVPGGQTAGLAEVVSADGRVIAGQGRPPEFTVDAFRWTEDSGLEVLPRLPVGGFYDVTGISPSGEYIVGRYSSPVTGGALSFVWSPSNGTISVGPLLGQGSPTWLNAVSNEGVAIGSTSVGETNTGASLNQAARWTEDRGLEVLPFPDAADEGFQSAAFDVLADGRIYGSSASGRWLYSDATGFDMLPEDAWLDRINSDGTFLSGTLTFPGADVELQAAYWTPQDGRQFLEPYSDDVERYGVTAMNDDGSIIIGEQNDVGYIVWVDQGEPVLLDDFLIGQGVDLTGYNIRNITAISDDSSTIVGSAFTLDGQVAIAIVIPSPGVISLGGLGLLSLRRRR